MKIKLPQIPREVLVGVVAVIWGLLAGAIFMLITGNNPFEGYTYLFKGGLMSVERFGNTLASATPLILTGLSVAFAFRTGLFNIGASGQMLFGGFCATVVGLTMDTLPRPILLVLILLAAILGGALWGFIPGLLKALFNVNEVVATIMMNLTSKWVAYYTIKAYFLGPQIETESQTIADAASLKTPWLTALFSGSYINLGFFVAIIVVMVIAMILNKTVLGYELKAAGHNRFASEYAGMNVNRNIIISMSIAGALAGLAGATQYLGYGSNIQTGVLPNQGFDGIAVALLGASSPVGVFISAIFFGILSAGKGFMTAMTDTPPEIGDTIIAMIIWFAATKILIERFIDKIEHFFKSKKREEAENA